MTTTSARKYLTCAETAKLLRANLKATFPGVKFSVRSSNYAGGASIDVSWTDGPTVREVDTVLDLYAGGRFDGMTDSMSYVTSLLGLPSGEVVEVSMGADFVHGSRDLSPEYIARRTAEVSERPEGIDSTGQGCQPCGSWPKSSDRWMAGVFDTGRDFCCSRECAGRTRARNLSANA